MIGKDLGPYRVLAKLGEGGMGEVYRATDPRLGRDIAIKILPPDVASDPDRLRRFEQEARAVAALNHPNIVTIYSVEQADDQRFLTMELIEGKPLTDLIPRQGLPLDRLLDIAVPLLDAVSAAHARGIVHRDLKPANVMVTPDGRVKVLDFGVAKLRPIASLAELTTQVTPGRTGDGSIIGTAPYMSPEQAEGREVDQRSDLFSLGVMLFEMATGQRPFRGDSSLAVLSAILKDTPPIVTDLKPELPREFARIVRRCLGKDPTRRYQSAIDLRNELDELKQDVPTGVSERPTTSEFQRLRRWRSIALIAGGVATLAPIGVGYLAWRPPSAAPLVIHATLAVSPAEEVGTDSVRGLLPGGSRRALAWSPDGKTLAYIGAAAGVRKIYLRDLDKGVARPLDGTEGARSLTFSPDGHWIAFWVVGGSTGTIYKIRAAGGPPAKIVEGTGLTAINWGVTGIVYTVDTRIVAVSPDGGEPRTLVESSGRLSSPVLLPEETAVMYTEHDKAWTSGDERVLVKPLNGAAAPKLLLRAAADAQYLPSGHLAFLRQGTLYVARFDRKSLETSGGEVAVKDVAQAFRSWGTSDLTLVGQFAISPQGTLAYLLGSPSPPVTEPVAIDRSGTPTSLGAPPDTYQQRVEVSPDGTKVAFVLFTHRSTRLVVYDRVRGITEKPFPEVTEHETVQPVWSPDGKLALNVVKGWFIPSLELYKPGLPESPQPVADSTGFYGNSWSKDGKRLLGVKANDLWFYSVADQGSHWTQVRPTPRKSEKWPTWSPDGHWLAYGSEGDVYLEDYPAQNQLIQISTKGGGWVAWNPKGNELLYVQGGNAPISVSPETRDEYWMMSVDVSTPEHPGRPVALFPFRPANLLLSAGDPNRCYSIAPDGQTFFALRVVRQERVQVTQIQVIVNWLDEVKRLVGPG